MKRKCTSSTPLVLGVLATILGLPSALLSGSFYILVTNLQTSNIFMYASLIACFLGLLFSLLTRFYPYLSGTVLVICALLSSLTLFIGNSLALIVTILYLLAGFSCFIFIDYKH